MSAGPGPREAHREYAVPPPQSDQPAWEIPVPLDRDCSTEPFPVDTLPSWLGDMVQAVAATSATPLPIAGCLGLAVIATVCGGRVEVEPQAGWREGTNLYVAGVMEPGERKSAVFSLMTPCLVELERAMAAETADERVLAAQRLRIAEQRRTQAERAAAKDDTYEAQADAMKAALAAAAIVAPPEPRLFADDVTPEALAGLLADNGGRMAELSADPSLFSIAAGRYANGAPNFEVYLKGHANDAIRVDRRGRPREVIDRAALTVGVTVQPGLLRDAGRNLLFRDRGLLDRFLYAVPPSLIGYRPSSTPPLPASVATLYAANVTLIAHTVDALSPSPLILGLEADALALLNVWRDELERRQRTNGDLAVMRAWASKLGGATVRIAGLLHVAAHFREDIARPIDAATVRAAITIARFFVPHAQVAFDLMGADPAAEFARRILAWIKLKARTTITRRDVMRDVRPRSNAKASAAALALLEACGYIRADDPDDRPGRPSQRYEVNPCLSGQ